MKYITVIPAYGRDYKSQKAAKADWDAGKDFTIATIMHPYDGKKINKEDAENSTEGLVAVNIRFNQMRGLAVVKIVQKGKVSR